MGLDCYFFSSKRNNTLGDFDVKKHNELREVDYYRKFYGLQDYMNNLLDKKGYDGDFNGALVRLTVDDLHELLLVANDLTSKEEYSGIFDFEEDRIRLYQTIAKCFNEVDRGNMIYYTGNW